MSVICIKGGRIIDPENRRDEVEDLWVVDQKIVASKPENLDQYQEIDARGLIVSPGFVDLQVHLREPGGTHKETIKTGTQAAAAGGFTTVVSMGNTSPVVDSPDTLKFILDKIEQDAVVNVLPTACFTVGREGKALAPIGSLAQAGAVALADNEMCVQDAEIMRRVTEYANMFNLVVIDHCQDYSLTYGPEGASMREGEWSLKLGLKGWPKEAEEMMVSRDCILARSTGCRIHIQHVSTANSVELIRRAKEQDIPVTAEVSPHHLSLTDEMIESYDSNFKMNPPLPDSADQVAIWEGLRDGTIDAIATGHAPHQDYEKEVEFDLAPYGIVGLETFLPVMWYEWVKKRDWDPLDLIALVTSRAAKVLDLDAGSLSVGSIADITIFDPEEEWIFSSESSFSRSCNSPWKNETLRGRVKYTICRGKLIFDNNQIV